MISHNLEIADDEAHGEQQRMTHWGNELMNEWMNNEGVSRTATATPGLLIINLFNCLLKLFLKGTWSVLI